MKAFLVLLCAAAGFMASADAQSPSTNSLVRFRISYGTTRYGDVDVELFDQDKPVTVSNFLAYVQSRRYDNSILTRCLPGFVLQGGEYAVPNPFSPSFFEIVGRVPPFGNITNEFRVGTLRSNVFGTIAMAKVDGAPNSANSAWFFNLADNSTELDNQNGGFTVFGQITAGANVLNSFNAFYLNHGIVDMTNAVYGTLGCPPLYRFPDGDYIGFPELPVAFYGIGCVDYSDLFSVQMIMISGPDVLPPKVVITTPRAKASVAGETVTVSGTASDNGSVQSVRVYLNTNAPVNATGTNSWTTTLTDVPAGTNTIFVEASDSSGNRGRAQVSFFHSVRVPLLLATSGAGTITGATNGQLLELTRRYSLTAKPNPGNLFVSWTGAFSEVSSTLTFQMDTNLAFTAVFATNQFPAVKGTYSGLFYDTNQVDQGSSGYLTLTLGDFGAYSAKLLMNGRSFKLSGAFAADGAETNALLVSDTAAVRLLMAVDFAGGSDQITGVASNLTFGGGAPWMANLALDRAVFNAKLNPAPLAGKYTMIIPTDTNSTAGPGGDGYATLKVDTKGGVSISGLLADTTKLSLKAPLSKNGALPVFASLYKGAGLLVGWVTFADQPDTDFSGLVNWFKRTQPTAKYYPHGFTNEVLLLGSGYTAPTTNRVLELTDTAVGFTNGNLSADFANDVTLGADNKIVNHGENKLALTIAKSTGLFSGSVTPPGLTKSMPFKGALLQKQNRGAGFLTGTNKTSRVTLGP